MQRTSFRDDVSQNNDLSLSTHNNLILEQNNWCTLLVNRAKHNEYTVYDTSTSVAAYPGEVIFAQPATLNGEQCVSHLVCKQ